MAEAGPAPRARRDQAAAQPPRGGPRRRARRRPVAPPTRPHLRLVQGCRPPATFKPWAMYLAEVDCRSFPTCASTSRTQQPEPARARRRNGKSSRRNPIYSVGTRGRAPSPRRVSARLGHGRTHSYAVRAPIPRVESEPPAVPSRVRDPGSPPPDERGTGRSLGQSAPASSWRATPGLASPPPARFEAERARGQSPPVTERLFPSLSLTEPCRRGYRPRPPLRGRSPISYRLDHDVAGPGRQGRGRGLSHPGTPRPAPAPSPPPPPLFLSLSLCWAVAAAPRSEPPPSERRRESKCR